MRASTVLVFVVGVFVCGGSCSDVRGATGTTIFQDGFESGDTRNWSAAIGLEPVQPSAGSLVVVEIHGNPNMLLDDDAEYFEVRNVTATPVDLQGTWIGAVDWAGAEPTDSTMLHQISQSVLVLPGERALLVRSADPTLNGFLSPDYVYDTILFTNSDVNWIRLRLFRPGWSGDEPPAPADLVDEVRTNGAFATADRGRSLQLDPALVPDPPTSTDNDDPLNFCLSPMVPSLEYATGNWGTPGAGNQCSPAP